MELSEPVIISALVTFSAVMVAAITVIWWAIMQLLRREREADAATIVAEQRNEKRLQKVFEAARDTVDAMSRAIDRQSDQHRAHFDAITARFDAIDTSIGTVAGRVGSHDDWARAEAEGQVKRLERLQQSVDKFAAIEAKIDGLSDSIQTMPKKIVEQLAGQVNEIKREIHLMRVQYVPPGEHAEPAPEIVAPVATP